MRLAYPYPRYSRINPGGAKAFMQLEFTQEEQAFREEVRTFLRESLPREISGKVLDGFELSRDDYVEWQRRLHARGWGAMSWPVQFGGAGWNALQHPVLTAIDVTFGDSDTHLQRYAALTRNDGRAAHV